MDDILRRRTPEEWVERIKGLRCDSFSLRKVICIVWFDYAPEDDRGNPLSRMAHRIPGNDPFSPQAVKAALEALGYPAGRAYKRSRIPKGGGGMKSREFEEMCNE
ncbi:MAG: hypothetical protein EOM20_14695 [Spartobacteria bacterium]|nr:hypothetical protein [Spartobacteria bacterium]